MSLVLECVVTGNPSPVVKWLKDGRELPLAPRLRLVHSNLVLSDVQISDGGRYTCLVQAEESAVISVNYTVEVLGEFSHTDCFQISYTSFTFHIGAGAEIKLAEPGTERRCVRKLVFLFLPQELLL